MSSPRRQWPVDRPLRIGKAVHDDQANPHEREQLPGLEERTKAPLMSTENYNKDREVRCPAKSRPHTARRRRRGRRRATLSPPAADIAAARSMPDEARSILLPISVLVLYQPDPR